MSGAKYISQFAKKSLLVIIVKPMLRKRSYKTEIKCLKEELEELRPTIHRAFDLDRHL